MDIDHDETLSSDERCAYCNSPIFDHGLICILACTSNCGSPTYFCNYARLSAYVDEKTLTTGDEVVRVDVYIFNHILKCVIQWLVLVLLTVNAFILLFTSIPELWYRSNFPLSQPLQPFVAPLGIDWQQ